MNSEPERPRRLPPAEERKFAEECFALRPVLMRVASRFARNVEDREDLATATMIKAIESSARFEPGTNLKAWLCMILTNKALSDLRRSWRQVEMPEGYDANIPCASSPHHNVELKETLEALDFLSPEQLDAFIAIAVDGLSYEEVAEEQQCSIGTVKSRVSRSRDTIERYFK